MKTLDSCTVGAQSRSVRKSCRVNPSLRQYFHEARPLLCGFGSRTVASISGPLVEKHVKRYDPAVPRDDKVPPGVSRHFTGASRYPWNHPCIAIFLRRGSHLISKVRMNRLDRAGDAIDRIAATDGALAGIVEYAIFGAAFIVSDTPFLVSDHWGARPPALSPLACHSSPVPS